MTPVVKGGAALGGCAAIAAGGYGAKVVIDGRKSYVEKWPDFLVPLDGAINAAYTSGKFGHEYGRYMTDPTKSKEWWEGSFKSIGIDKRTIKDLFNNTDASVNGKAIGKGFGTEDDALSKICDDIYKIDKSKVKTGGGNGEYKEDEVWKYCSPLGAKPKTIVDAKEESNYSAESAYGKEKKDKLVAIKNNDRFWSFQEARFRGRKEDKFADNSLFKKAFQNKNNSVKDLCKKSYEANTSSISSYKKDILEFCSLTGKDD